MSAAAAPEVLYRGSVKDLVGPFEVAGKPAVVFQYTDAYSVFDWGRMPDLLPSKGAALATLAAELFERLESAQSWKAFSGSPEALGLRKGNRFGAAFNELGERLQAEGLRTHYLGVLPALPARGAGLKPVSLDAAGAPVRQLVVRQVSVVKPQMKSVLGRSLPDYLPTRSSPAPRLVPLEVVFRFSCPPGSSLAERVGRDPGYLASIGFAGTPFEPGVSWDFPVLELFTKLETTDRPVSLSEALAISGLGAEALQELLLKTAWVAGFLRELCHRAGLELADGKLEWAIDEAGETVLVDAIGPDELRILSRDGSVQLSKEFLRAHYRATPWYEKLESAKQSARAQGTSDWRRLVVEQPPALPPAMLEQASQLYPVLANALAGRALFKDAWTLERLTASCRPASRR